MNNLKILKDFTVEDRVRIKEGSTCDYIDWKLNNVCVSGVALKVKLHQCNQICDIDAAFVFEEMFSIAKIATNWKYNLIPRDVAAEKIADMINNKLRSLKFGI
jgi:hypothetical protein